MKTVSIKLLLDCTNCFKKLKNESFLSSFNDKLVEEINNTENGFREPNKSQLLHLLEKY